MKRPLPFLLFVAAVVLTCAHAFSADVSLSTLYPQDTDSNLLLNQRQTAALSLLSGGTTIAGTNRIDRQTLTTTTTGAYTAGDSLVTNYVTLTNAVRQNGGSCLVNGFTILMHCDVAPALTLYVFDRPPAITNDANAALNLTATALSGLVWHHAVAATDWKDMGTNRVWTSTFTTFAFVNAWTNCCMWILPVIESADTLTMQPELITRIAY